jgi:hypothetical protein
MRGTHVFGFLTSDAREMVTFWPSDGVLFLVGLWKEWANTSFQVAKRITPTMYGRVSDAQRPRKAAGASAGPAALDVRSG